MILSSHQPNFLPYLGVFYKAYKSDIFVMSDDVLYSKKGMHNYNYIRTKNGEQRLTIPVKAHCYSRICDVEVADPERSIRKAVKTLRETYSKTEHFQEGMELLDIMEGMAKEGLMLSKLNIGLIQHIINRMGIRSAVFVASEDLSLEGHKDDRILMMCEELSADVYYSGTGAKAYHVPELFDKQSVKLEYSDYQTVVYSQKYEPFMPNMSVIDYIFNEGYSIPEGWI